MMSAKAHSDTGYDEPLVVSTVQTSPRPGGLDVDAAGKAVAFQLADDLQVGGLIQDRGVECRAAVADDQVPS